MHVIFPHNCLTKRAKKEQNSEFFFSLETCMNAAKMKKNA